MADHDVARASTGAVIAAGALAGLTGTVPIGRLRGWRRAAYSVAEGPLFALVMSRQKDLSAPQRFGIAGMATGAAALGKTLGVTMDRRAEQWLVRRGVTHPRIVIGVMSGLVEAAWMAASGGPRPVEESAPAEPGAEGLPSSETPDAG